jgi:hypothetical protein
VNRGEKLKSFNPGSREIYSLKWMHLIGEGLTNSKPAAATWLPAGRRQVGHTYKLEIKYGISNSTV